MPTQLALARALAAALPAGGPLSPAAASTLARLALQWLSARAVGSVPAGPVPQQLQCEALRLLGRVAKEGRVQLAPADTRQLLKQLHSAACSAAAARQGLGPDLDLLCCAADVLGQLPQLAAPAARQEGVASAISTVVQALDLHTRLPVAGPSDAGRAALFLQLLRALQALLVEVGVGGCWWAGGAGGSVSSTFCPLLAACTVLQRA